MRTLSRKFFAIGLLLALLVCSTSRAVPVFALAQPDPFINAEFAPVYDTQIYQIEDFMRENLTPAQGDVFWIMMGLYVAAQGGASEYELVDPYANEDGVLNWLKSCGIQLYNSLLGMGAIGPDPITGIDYRPYIKGAADVAMGMAVKASTYDDVDDFVADVDTHEKYLVPFLPDTQSALNYVFARSNGMYDWQFTVSEFETSLDYPAYVLQPTDPYWGLLASYPEPRVRAKDPYSYNYKKNYIVDCPLFRTYTNLFLNTTNGLVYFVSDDGTMLGDRVRMNNSRWLYSRGSNDSVSESMPNYPLISQFSYPALSSYPDIVQYLLDHPSDFCSDLYIFYSDFIQHYYYGSSWDNKTEIFHSTDLNLDPNELPYYQQITNNTLLDIKGILSDLVNTTDLWDVFINNLFDLDGVIVTDPQLIRVTTQILQEIQTQNVPLPVDLNDIAEYTDNSYMDRVKEEAKRGGNALAALVAFWHNCDANLIYVLFGACITVLVGAFIGKWGHS